MSLSVPFTCSKGQVPVGGVVWDSGGQLGDLHAVFLLFRALQRTRLYHAHRKSLKSSIMHELNWTSLPMSAIPCHSFPRIERIATLDRVRDL